MMFEIEMKAHTDFGSCDPKQIEMNVSSFASFQSAFDRFDRYWHTNSSKTNNFRLRIDNSQAFVTFKNRSITDGLELNEETEFSVSDGEAFAKMIAMTDCDEYLNKHKIGKSFSYNGYTIELTHLVDIGNFIEIEYLCPTKEKSTVEKIKNGILEILKKAGIPENAIETKTYSQLIFEKKVN